MIATLKGWITGLRARKSSRIAKDYGYLSGEEKREVNRLREEHRFGNISVDRDTPNRPRT